MLRRFLLFSAAILIGTFGVQAQKSIWGTSSKFGTYGHGYIFKTDSVGNSPQIKYHFKGTDGSGPGVLLNASNGKLYGLTTRGGAGDTPSYPSPVGGVLFEYDMVLDSLTVLHEFNFNGSFAYDRPNAEQGLLEATPGVLYGIAQSGRIVFKYTIATQAISLVVIAPLFTGGTYNNTQSNYFAGPLYMASNGFLYTALTRNSTCPIASPDAGGFARINIGNNTVTTVYLNPCSFSQGINYRGPEIEYNNKLYSTAAGGDVIGFPAADPGRGVVYEFNPANNTYSKTNFAGGLQGQRPMSIMKANNGKFYGTAEGGSPYTVFSQNFANGSGIIYEYNPTAHTITSVYDFKYNVIDSIGEYGVLSLCGSNNKLYGTTYNGIFEYNPYTDVAKPRARMNSSTLSHLIELCAKPSYKQYTLTSYTVCAGSPFTFDLHNDNASTVVWKKNNIIQANQTSSILHFNNITAADAGTWICTLTNECGSTTTPAIQITVNTAGTGTVTSTLSPSNISICEGSSTTLSGNNGGTWNTGATTSTITVSQAGQYQVSNVNACGNTYSNVVTVSYIPTTTPPVAVRQVIPLCENSSIILSGNTSGGTWNTGATTPNIQVPIVANTNYYIVNTHVCGSDTSNIITFYPAEVLDTSAVPVINTSGPTTFCQSGTVTLISNSVSNPNAFWIWEYTGGTSSANQTPLNVTQAGQYILSLIIGQCGVYRSDTVNVVMEQPLTQPTITAQGPTTFCANASVVLQSNLHGYTWNTGDTSITITVASDGAYYVSKQNTCGAVTSNTINITTNALPTVDFVPPVSSFCTTQSSVTLSGGTPAGGIYSGVGVSGGVFNPSLAGAGTHNITYTYTDANGCSNASTKPFSVASLTQPLLLSGNSTNAFCSGGQLLLFQTQFQEVDWSNGTTGVVLFVNQPGTYYFSVNNACGVQTSNSITVTMNPTPIVTYQQTPNIICSNNGNITLSAASPAGGTYTGAGVSGNTFNPIAAGAGVHTITYTYTQNNCTASAQQTISVGADTAYITPLSSTTFCQGDSVILQGNSNAGNWNTGVTAASITVYQPGTYFVTNSSSCGTLTSQSVQVNVLPASTGNNPQTICAGDSYSINGETYTTAGNYTSTFQSASGCDSVVTTQLTVNPVYNTNNPQTICAGNSYSINGQTYTAAGNYITTFQSLNGCDSTVTTQLNITDVNVDVSQDGVQLTALLTNANYQWIHCNGTAIAGQTQQTFVAPQNGSYAVIITANGCSDTSTCYEVNNVSIQESDIQSSIILFPNPAVDYIQLNTSLFIRSIHIQNAVGQTLLYEKGTKQISITNLPTGTYFITAETDNGNWQGKFVKL